MQMTDSNWVPWIILGFVGVMVLAVVFDLVSQELRERKWRRWQRESRAIRARGEVIKARIEKMKWK